MKLGDIRGESVVAPDVADQDWVVVDNGDQVAQFKPGNVRDHNHGNRTNWDVICDVGTFIKQTSVADALTNYRPEGFSEVEIHFANPNAGQKGFTWEAAADIWTKGGASTFHGSAVDSWTEKTFGNGDGEYLGEISQGNVFAPINVLRNGYNCEDFGACSG